MRAGIGRARSTRHGAACVAVLIALGVSSCGSPDAAPTGDATAQVAASGYAYPLTPESDPEEWAAHEPAELVELLRIPQDALEQLSTTDVVVAVLDYPYVGNYLAYSTPEQGLEALRSQSDALAELLERDDAAGEVERARAALDETDAYWTIKAQVLDGVAAALRGD